VKVVPNILSVFRICLVPVFIAAYFLDDRDIRFYAILVFAIAGLSDILDGYLARRFKAQSKLGMLLDPLGDKLMTFTVLICIAISMPIILWAVIIFFIKEVLMGIGGLLIHKKAHIELPPANIIGKISTVVFSLVCLTLMLFSNLSNADDFKSLAIILVSVATGLALAALASYIISFTKIMKSIVKSPGNNDD